MVKYYDLDKQDVTREMVKTVPEEILIKRNWIPYVKNVVEVPDTDPIPPNTTEIINNVYIETFHEVYHVKTLEEVKQERYDSFNSQCGQEIIEKYPLSKQINITRLAPNYTEQDRTNMNEFIDDKRNICNTAQEALNNAETIEEVETIYYKRYIYDENDEIINTEYWVIE